MLIDNLTLQDLDNEYSDIAECIGIDAFKKLVYLCGGSMLYVPKCDSLVKALRDRNIQNEFNGENYRLLARKYGLTERRVRDILAKSNFIQ